MTHFYQHRKVYTNESWGFLLKEKIPKFYDSALLRDVPLGLKGGNILYNEEQLNILL